MKILKSLLPVSICVIAAMVIFVGCSSGNGDSPIAPTNESINNIATMELLHNGKLVVLIDNEKVNGAITAQMAQNSDVYEVEFYNEMGELINNDPQKYKLAWRNDTSFATFEQLSEWGFFIYGNKQGDTAFQILIENGNNEVYSSPSILLKVR